MGIRGAAQRLLERLARPGGVRGRLEAAQEIVGKTPKGYGVGEREAVAMHLRVLQTMLRDIGVLSTSADGCALANADLTAVLEARGPRSITLGSSARLRPSTARSTRSAPRGTPARRSLPTGWRCRSDARADRRYGDSWRTRTADPTCRCVSGPVSRTQTFLLDTVTRPPALGDAVVIRTEQGTALASVVPTIPGSGGTPRAAGDERLRPPGYRRRPGAARSVSSAREQDARRSALRPDPAAEAGDEAVARRAAVRRLRGSSSTSRPKDASTSASWCDCSRREFRTRIEMRQIGVRDEARMLGGYGSCGRPLCCTTWLQTFEPVSIRMAKQQDLALNPVEAVGPVRPAEVLPAVRAAERQRRVARRLRRRGHLQQPDGLRHGWLQLGTCTCHA